MDYVPKKIQSNYKSNDITNNISNDILNNEKVNINNELLFPSLGSNNKQSQTQTQTVVNWKNITNNLSTEVEPIKELIKEKKTNNEISDKIANQSNILEDNKQKIEKVKPIFVDESGWTHIVKSNKPKYKEKKVKNTNEDIDKLILDVIKS